MIMNAGKKHQTLLKRESDKLGWREKTSETQRRWQVSRGHTCVGSANWTQWVIVKKEEKVKLAWGKFRESWRGELGGGMIKRHCMHM